MGARDGRTLRAGLHRRGVRRPRGRRPCSRGRPAAAVQPVQRGQGRWRPAGARLRAHLRRQRLDHARRQHLRPEPVPGEARAAVRHQRHRRRAAARVRRREAGTRMAARRGSLRRDRARPARGRAGRDLQRRGRGSREPRGDVPDPRAHRPRSLPRSATSKIAQGTIAVTRSTMRSCARSAGRLSTHSARVACRRRSTGTATIVAGGSRSSPAPTGRTTRSSTQTASGPSRLSESAAHGQRCAI